MARPSNIVTILKLVNLIIYLSFSLLPYHFSKTRIIDCTIACRAIASYETIGCETVENMFVFIDQLLVGITSLFQIDMNKVIIFWMAYLGNVITLSKLVNLIVYLSFSLLLLYSSKAGITGYGIAGCETAGCGKVEGIFISMGQSLFSTTFLF